ncbi:MAG: DUF4465 domain-containing protein [Lentimicrobiaceae bacterium]|nr:DUF4465 domain-containing protein [Lentimicrobiaceae bacterium]
MKKSILFYFLILFLSIQLFAQPSDTTMLNLLNPTYPSSFVYTPNGYWIETYNDTDFTFFKSQIFSFSHQIEGPGSAVYQWHGFTACNSGDNDNHYGQDWNDYQWGCMAGGGIKTNEQGEIMKDANGEVIVEKGLPYLVAYWYYMIEPEWWFWGIGDIFLDEPTHCLQILLDDGEEYEAVGVYMNIHPWVYYANMFGDGSSLRPLNQEGDYFKVIFHGLNPDNTESGKSVEHIMAKFENGQLIQSSKWEWVDLSSLGEIGGIYCTLSSTIENFVGPISPMYFCMDKLQVRTKVITTFIPVSNIINVPDTAMVGNPLTLTGTVIPSDATHQIIEWNVLTTGETGASITGNKLNTTGIGTAVIRATIKNGSAENEDYIKDFEIVVIKSTQDPPNAPTLSSKTETSITLNEITGCEYRINENNWQESNIFNNLSPNTTYGFEARKKETETHYASNCSPIAYFTTDDLGMEDYWFDKVQIYSFQNSVFIKNVRISNLTSLPVIEILDLLGRMIYKDEIKDTETVITFQFTPGIYHVRLILHDHKTTIFKKILIY